MRIFNTILLFLFSCPLMATNYYVSHLTGNDNTHTGLSPAQAWASIAKVNSFLTFAANDSILFERGGTYYGGIVVRRSGLNYGAFGSGAKPVIIGVSTITGWTNLGGNIWEAVTTGVKVTNNLVLRNGVAMQVGRYPNANASNGGYLTNTGATTTTITGPALATATNWTNAEVAFRTNHWTIDRKIVAAHSGGTITFNSANSVTPKVGFGYFFQRDARTLDQDGEWYQSPAGRLRMYFSNNNPNAYTVQAATVDTLFKSVQANTSVSNMSFYGAGRYAVRIDGVSGVRLINCDMNMSGNDGFTTWFCTNITAIGCTSDSAFSSGMRLKSSANGTVNILMENNTIEHIGMLAGMESTGESNPNSAVNVTGGSGVTIRNNWVHVSGYNGIHWQGDNVLIENNYVDSFCFVRDDGGGIYTFEASAGSALPTRVNRTIRHNIVKNGIGQRNGTDAEESESACVGIYLDDGTRTVLVDYNVVTNIAGNGYHGNGNHSNTLTNNIFHNCRYAISIQRFAAGDPVRNMVFKRNTYAHYRFRYRNLGINSPTLITQDADIIATATMDSNWYSKRNGTDTSISSITRWTDNTHTVVQELPFTYLSGLPTETHATQFANTGTLYTNPSSSIAAVNFPGFSKKDQYGNVFDNSTTVGAWYGVILIDNGSITPPTNNPPIANAGGDKTVAFPASSTSVTGSAIDPEGGALTYAWTQTSGPSASILSPTSATTTINGMVVAGNYAFRFTATDPLGASGSDNMQVHVLDPPNANPTANAGADKIITLPVNTTTVTGSGADSDGTIVSYVWTKTAGPSTFTIASPSSATTALNNLVEGTYQFTLTVTDNRGGTGFDVVNVVVNPAIPPPNVAPTANAGSNVVMTLPTNSTTLTGSGADTDGTISTYGWAKVSGPATYTITSPSSASTEITGLVAGTYVFELTVTDDDGATGTDQVIVTVNAAPANVAPTAAAGADQTLVLPTNSTTISASGSTDSDGTISTYAWTKESGPATGTITSPGSSSTGLTSLVEGTYVFRVTVTDDDGATATDDMRVFVLAGNQAPVASAGLDQVVTLPTDTTSLVGSAIDADGFIASYSWTKLSGPSVTIVSPTSATTALTGLSQGVYQFQLVATDNAGGTSTSTVYVTVSAAPVENQEFLLKGYQINPN